MRPAEGRKAVLLISTGIDTFQATPRSTGARRGTTIGNAGLRCRLAGLVERSIVGSDWPITKIDWPRAKERLKTLARSSGGRAYLRDTELDIPAIYDDMMEHLRVRLCADVCLADCGRARQCPLSSSWSRGPALRCGSPTHRAGGSHRTSPSAAKAGESAAFVDSSYE